MKHVRFFLVLLAAFLFQYAVAGAESGRPVVLFDQGHRQFFVIEKEGDLHLSRLAGLFREAGFEVRSGTGKITQEGLRGVAVIVSSGPFYPLSAAEINALTAFMDGGGRLVVMLHIASPVEGLLKMTGIEASLGPLNEMESTLAGNNKDFVVSRLEAHPLTKGLKDFSVYGAWGLQATAGQTQVVARTSPQAWVDLNRDGKRGPEDSAGEFGIAVAGTYGRGLFVVFGDDTMFQNNFLKEQNLALGRNLVQWLLKGE